jgi:hypothetical protein
MKKEASTEKIGSCSFNQEMIMNGAIYDHKMRKNVLI